MAGTNTSLSDAAVSEPGPPERVTLGMLAARHKAACALGLATLLVLVLVIVATALSSSAAVALTDGTSCSQWAAASPAQRTAYAQLYVREYGGLPDGARAAGTITATIGSDCARAAYLGEADEVTVLAAVKHAY